MKVKTISAHSNQFLLSSAQYHLVWDWWLLIYWSCSKNSGWCVLFHDLRVQVLSSCWQVKKEMHFTVSATNRADLSHHLLTPKG